MQRVYFKAVSVIRFCNCILYGIGLGVSWLTCMAYTADFFTVYHCFSMFYSEETLNWNVHWCGTWDLVSDSQTWSNGFVCRNIIYPASVARVANQISTPGLIFGDIFSNHLIIVYHYLRHESLSLYWLKSYENQTVEAIVSFFCFIIICSDSDFRQDQSITFRTKPRL